jgi:hypothetical protein
VTLLRAVPRAQSERESLAERIPKITQWSHMTVMTRAMASGSQIATIAHAV